MNETECLESIVANESLWKKSSPCFVANERQLRASLETIKRLLHGEILYSLKTNPHPAVARIVRDQDCGFLLSSIEELDNLVRIDGVNRSNIVFQSPSLTLDQYQKARAIGVSRYVADSHQQLDLILSGANAAPPLTEVLIRVNTGITVPQPELPYSTDSFLGFPVEDAWGAFERLDRAVAGTGIRVGLHNHFLSQNKFPELWAANLDSLACFVELLQKRGIRLGAVDFGGGYPISYRNGSLPLERIAALVAATTRRMRNAYPDLRFMFEPGRKVVGESITLIATVSHVKRFRGTNVAILDCSVYNASMDTLVVGLHLPAVKLGENDGRLIEYVLRGSTPDSLDVFNRKALLPELEVGDRVAFFHAGAYSFWSDFISLRKPECVFI